MTDIVDYVNGLKSLSGLRVLTAEQSDFLFDAADEIERLRNVAQSVKLGDFYLVPREIIDQFPEINVNNYDHDDACALNAWGCEVVTNANPAGQTAPLPAQCGGK
jgi:hypothetical protein